MNLEEKYMKIAIKEAQKAYKKGEIPVGAVIVKNNKIISKAHNMKEKYNNPLNHAEILCIKKACKKIKNWRLDNCILYVTMEPCMMCCGAILESRIKKIVFSVYNEKTGYTKKIKNIEIKSNILEKEYKMMLKSFFKKIR